MPFQKWMTIGSEESSYPLDPQNGGKMQKSNVTRRTFMGGLATALGVAGLNPLELAAGQRGQRGARNAAPADPNAPKKDPVAEYDNAAKLANNENPYGPSETVLKAMNDVWKYSNRYGYPDPGIRQVIAEHHGVKPENVMISAGSGEILKVVDATYLPAHKYFVGADPTYDSMYRYVTETKGMALKIPLRKDYTTDIEGIIHATKLHARDVGIIYLCNPNNPTANIIPKNEIKMLLDSVPEEIPVFIDEAYHHFVDNPNYESSIKYVLEGRRVIIARTFSKIAGLAGMRLGFAIATPDILAEMSPQMIGSISSLVKYGGVAALKDTANEQKVKSLNKQIRERTTAELAAYGYEVIPSDANFFMVNMKTDIAPLGQKFRDKGVLVGRKFPPMDNWLRVSVGTDQEMKRFMTAFKEIMPAGKPSTSAAGGE
jgi:histidinol-phosphate aminotransferase